MRIISESGCGVLDTPHTDEGSAPKVPGRGDR